MLVAAAASAGTAPKLPGRLQAMIEERHNEVDDDDEEANLIRDEIVRELAERGLPDARCAGVNIPASVMGEIVNRALGDRMTLTSAGTKLKTMMGGIPELSKAKTMGRKVWRWRGKEHHGNFEDLPERRKGIQI